MIEIREPGFEPFIERQNSVMQLFALIDVHADCEYDLPSSAFYPGNGKPVSDKPHAEIFICTAALEGYTEAERFLDLLERPNEFQETFASLGMSVNVYTEGTLSELRQSLRTEADFRWVFAHGEEFSGIQCADGYLEWNELLGTIAPTGLFYISSCYSADGYCEDEEGYFPFIDGITDTVSAVIASAERAHHLPWRYGESNTHFEIQRVAYLLKSCFEVGFEKAVLRTQKLLRNHFPDSIAETIIEHEVCRGDAGWGKLTSEENS